MKKYKNKISLKDGTLSQIDDGTPLQIDWGIIIIDVCIIIMVVKVSIWQDDPNYLWLLVLLFCTNYITKSK